MSNLRACSRAGSASAIVAAASILSAPILSTCAYAADAAPDIFGTYWATQYNAKIQVVGGGDLPLTDAGKAAYDKNIAGLKDGSITDAARKFCVPDGLPRVLAT